MCIWLLRNSIQRKGKIKENVDSRKRGDWSKVILGNKVDRVGINMMHE